MKTFTIKVGGTYVDGCGCTVKILKNAKKTDHPYVALLDWSTSRSSPNAGYEIAQYDKYGKSDLPHERNLYDLRPL